MKLLKMIWTDLSVIQRTKNYLTNLQKISKKILFLSLLIILFSLSTNAGKVNYILNFGGCTGSMKPAMDCNDEVIANTVDNNFTIGNIYCYRPDYRDFSYPGRYRVCHRLINITKEGFIFKGDNNDRKDPPIRKKYIIFEIVNIIR